MIRHVETQQEQNLRRWREAGEPYRWVESHGGRWNDQDWRGLLAELTRSDYWPLDPEAVGQELQESRRHYNNLKRWRESGAPRRWVDDRQGRWDHEAWLALLEGLRLSPYWPLEPSAVGAVLQEMQQEWSNLERWQRSPQAREWVASREGNWGLEEWTALWSDLQQSEFWPINPERAELALRRLTAEWWNLARWQKNGQPVQWVQAHQGSWTHDDWVELLGSLEQSQFWPLDPEAVGRILEETKQRYWNLVGWQRSEAPTRWVDARSGQWTQAEWQALLAELERSTWWPLDPEMAEVVLEECRNLRRWLDSGEPRRWIDAKQGRWEHEDWLALLESLRQSGFWPLDPVGVGRLLHRLKSEWWNLNRWRESGLARLWVEAHDGRWSDEDRRALWLWLSASEFWPVHPESLDRVLGEVQREHEQQSLAVKGAA